MYALLFLMKYATVIWAKKVYLSIYHIQWGWAWPVFIPSQLLYCNYKDDFTNFNLVYSFFVVKAAKITKPLNCGGDPGSPCKSELDSEKALQKRLL